MTLVLLHALPLDASMWDGFRDAFDGDVIAPTLYGLGDSVEEWARSIVESLPDGPVTIVGNSIGGSVAVEMARMVPDRVELLVLLGAKPGHRPEPALRARALELLATEGIDRAWPEFWEPLFGPSADATTVDRARRIAAAHPIAAIMRGVHAFHTRLDREAFLRDWPGRVLVMSGEHDRTPGRGATLAASLRDGHYVEVADAGHYLPLEAAGAVVAAVRRALAERPTR